MPEQETLEKAEQDKEEGKAASTQAGEFVREEIEHVRQGKHGARSPKQAIAIGLSKARRAGVALPKPKKGRTSEKVRRQAERDTAKGRSRHRPAAKRPRATRRALRRESGSSTSRSALAGQARSSARRRGKRELHQASMKALGTKGKSGLRRAARKAAATRR